VLFAAAVVWTLIRPPGNHYDLNPAPVPAWGWLTWGGGIMYLASTAMVHASVGTALRRAQILRGSLVRIGVVANAALILVAGRSMVLAADSHTHAYGLEVINATLLAGAALSALLMLSGVRGRRGEVDIDRLGRSFRRRLPLVMQVVAVIVTAAGLLLVEALPLARPAARQATMRGKSDEALPLDLAALLEPVGHSRRMLGFQRSRSRVLHGARPRVLGTHLPAV
jgi:hypothetical protein